MTEYVRRPEPLRDRLEFENGALVKIDGFRYSYMDGDSLLRLVSDLGRELAKTQQALYEVLDGACLMAAGLHDLEELAQCDAATAKAIKDRAKDHGVKL